MRPSHTLCAILAVVSFAPCLCSQTSDAFDPGANAVEVKNGTFDEKTNAVHLEADAKSRSGKSVHYMVDGKVDNNTMSGTWNHDNRKGDFKITKK